MSLKVLIAEDETDTLQLLSTYFRGRGYEVVTALDGMSAIESFRTELPDLLLLDIRMPRLNGWQVLEQVRAEMDTPVIILSALDQPNDAVKGLGLGADDYLRKPFDLSELDARVRAVLRRAGSGKEKEQVNVNAGPLEIDDRAKSVRLSGQEIKLSPREYRLLCLLAGAPGRVFSHQEIIEEVWPSDSRADTSDVKQYIHLLRAKIEQDPPKPSLILTAKGFGYKYSG